MIKRYFSLFSLPSLMLVLAVFYALVITSDNINGVAENVVGMFFMTIVAFLWNSTATENWKWVKTGVPTDKTNSILSISGNRLKKARLGETNPLFVYADGEYHYYDDNYGMGNEHNKG